MLHRLALATLIAAGGVAAVPQNPPPQASSGSVLVTVLDAATGQPISGASIGAGDVSTKTGADGRARLDKLSVGPRWLSASADGYLGSRESLAPKMFDRLLGPPESDPRRWAARNPQFPGSLPVTLQANAEVEVEFLLPRGGSIEGRVVNPDRTPVRAVMVKALLLYSEASDRRIFVPVDAARTDQEGRFGFSGLRPSSYYLRVETGYDDEFARVPIFYPSETSPRRAQAVEVRGAEITRLEIGFRYVQPFRFTSGR